MVRGDAPVRPRPRGSLVSVRGRHRQCTVSGGHTPQLVHRGREEEDYTRTRPHFKDATNIAKKVAELRCHVPYQLEGHWRRTAA